MLAAVISACLMELLLATYPPSAPRLRQHPGRGFDLGGFPYVLAFAARELWPGELVVIRMVVAGLLLGIFVGPRRLWRALRGHFASLLGLSLFGVAIPGILYLYVCNAHRCRFQR